MTELMTFREQLLELKEAKGWSEMDLAEATGLPWSTVHSYFQTGKSKAKPSFRNLVLIARAFDVPVTVFEGCADLMEAPPKRAIRKKKRPKKNQ